MRWIIDPIDGTRNFVRHVPIWAVLIGARGGGEITAGAIHNPVTDEMYSRAIAAAARLSTASASASPPSPSCAKATFLHAGLGIVRKAGWWPGFERLIDGTLSQRGPGDYLGYTLVASGRGEIYAELDLKPWDLAPCKIVVEEAGGRFTDFEGRRPSIPARRSSPTATCTTRRSRPCVVRDRVRDPSGRARRRPAGGAGASRAARRRRHAVTVAAQPRIGALLVALGVADRAVAFDTLGLDALFSDAPLAADAPLARQLAAATRVVVAGSARAMPHFARRLPRARAGRDRRAGQRRRRCPSGSICWRRSARPATARPILCAAARCERRRARRCVPPGGRATSACSSSTPARAASRSAGRSAASRAWRIAWTARS